MWTPAGYPATIGHRMRYECGPLLAIQQQSEIACSTSADPCWAIQQQSEIACGTSVDHCWLSSNNRKSHAVRVWTTAGCPATIGHRMQYECGPMLASMRYSEHHRQTLGKLAISECLPSLAACEPHGADFALSSCGPQAAAACEPHIMPHSAPMGAICFLLAGTYPSLVRRFP